MDFPEGVDKLIFCVIEFVKVGAVVALQARRVVG